MLNHGFIRFKMLRIQGAGISSADRFRIVLKSLLTVGMLLLASGIWEEAPRVLRVAAALGTLAVGLWELRLAFHRLRPRGRARNIAFMGAVLTVVLGIMAAAVAADAESGWKIGTGILGGFAVLAAGTALWSFLRWRKLRAEAEIRLQTLRKARKRRATSRERGY